MPVILEVGESPEVSNGWVLGQPERETAPGKYTSIDPLLVDREGESLAHAFLANGIINFYNLCERAIHLIFIHPPGTFHDRE